MAIELSKQDDVLERMMQNVGLQGKNLEQAKSIQKASVMGLMPPESTIKKADQYLAKTEQNLEKNEDYRQASPEQKIELAIGELKKSQKKEMSMGELFARSLVAIAPALIGQAVGGSMAGAAAGAASVKALEEIDKLKKAEREATTEAQKEEIKSQIEILKLQSQRQKEAQERQFKAKELQLKERGILADERKAPKVDEGKQLTSEQVNKIAGIESSRSQLGKILEEVDLKAEFMGPVAGRVSAMTPYATEAKAFDARMKLAAQKIGVALEGGKLTDEDISRYRQMLPNIQDTPEVAKEKIKIVSDLLDTEQSVALETLKQSGYNVGRFAQAPSQQVKQQPASKAGMRLPGQMREAQAAPSMPMKVIQNGFEYIYNPATGKYE
jgi:hypothetical protein